MEIEIITQILEGLKSAVLIIGLFLSFRAVKVLVQYESTERMHYIKKNVFVWLMWGMLFLVIATLGKNISLTFGGEFILWEVFLILHYLFFIFALVYFWKSSGQLHQISSREKIFLVGVVCLVLVGVVYLLSYVVLSHSAENLVERTLNWLYPIMISLMFISTYAVHSRVRAKLINRSLGYISNGIFLYFLGYLLYVYMHFGESKLSFLSIVYSGLFLLSAGYYLLGFLVAKKRLTVAK